MSPEVMRDRARRPERGGNNGSVDGGGSKSSVRDRSTTRSVKRVYVSNIPYEYRWQDLKDLFRRIVGPVDFVELFVDENYKPRGCGIVEFKDVESVEKCIEKMHRHELNGREIIVKEDHGEERDKFGRIGRGGGDSKHGGGDSGRSGGGGGGGSARGQNYGGNQRDRDSDRAFMLVLLFKHFLNLKISNILIQKRISHFSFLIFSGISFSLLITQDLSGTSEDNRQDCYIFEDFGAERAAVYECPKDQFI